MSPRLIALLATACLVAGVHAQSNPPGVAVPPNTPGVAGGKAESRPFIDWRGKPVRCRFAQRIGIPE